MKGRAAERMGMKRIMEEPMSKALPDLIKTVHVILLRLRNGRIHANKQGKSTRVFRWHANANPVTSKAPSRLGLSRRRQYRAIIIRRSRGA